MSRIINFNVDKRSKRTIKLHGFKRWNAEKFDEFCSLDITLQGIVLYAAHLAFACYGKQIIITSMFREGGGVHNYYRGCDIDVDHKEAYGGLYPREAASIAGIINMLFAYDPDRPNMNAAVYALTGEKAIRFGDHLNHIHFQVSTKTRFNRPTREIGSP